MSTWAEVTYETPELAARVRAIFDASKHKTMATLRKDGSPRISGTEANFYGSDIFVGSMYGAVKARDLQRDPRVALHSATVDTELTNGDAKISGRAAEITNPDEIAAFARANTESTGQEPPGEFHLFRIDVSEIVLTRIGDPPDHLVIEVWRAGRGTERIERR
ncbi:MAG: hypothetical protein JWL83_3699 [Actinomycetia bacterium]|nr:hypothetical protein [Actinomycetes bacterium]